MVVRLDDTTPLFELNPDFEAEKVDLEKKFGPQQDTITEEIKQKIEGVIMSALWTPVLSPPGQIKLESGLLCEIGTMKIRQLM